ncbi:MAG: Smr/MutS family protein [Bacilli bacterium]|nr:Smr/MutS family protein [Bacilli bacterium]
MGAMQDAFEVLQLSEVVAKVASFAHTEQGKAALLALRPIPLKERDRQRIYLKDMQGIVDEVGPFPIVSSSDLSSRVDMAKKGGTLGELDFSRVLSDLNQVKDLKAHLRDATQGEGIRSLVLGLPTLEPLRQGILRVLAPDLSIKDTASVELKRIRSSIAHKQKEITKRLDAILNENRGFLSGDSWTMRNGHYVLPVANAHKHQVRGYVQDVSSSGGTAFIEPEALLRLQNDIALLQAEEKEEIRRILASLSRLLGTSAAEFSFINQTIGQLDFHQSKVLYGREINGHLGEKSVDGSLFLPGARHPLIPKNKVVANDFSLSPSRPILVLSGPNAGGKTVALKTLGTICMMFAMALPLPCLQGAEIPEFENVVVDIGDSQSLFDNLSTFSGHIGNIKDILLSVKKEDLVLLDEVGTGTSPKEGEALALAIVEELKSIGCYALVSSHFEGLKSYALSSTDVENASLLFDEKTLSPTYVLRVGYPGESYGLDVARRLGLPSSVIARAEEFLQKEDSSVEGKLRHLSELTLQAEEKAASVSKKEEELSLVLTENKRLKAELAKKQEKFEEECRLEKQRLLEKAQEEIQQAIRDLSSPDAKLHHAIKAKANLDALEEKQEGPSFDHPLQVGDYASAPSFGVEGRIQKLDGKRSELLTPEGMTVRIDAKCLVPAEAPVPKKAAPKVDVDALPEQGLSLEIVLIGMREAEAMAELDKYLDRCRLKGFKRVRVIHGLGSGILRRATHAYLKAHSSFVDRFELGGEFEGGGGATVVYLK